MAFFADEKLPLQPRPHRVPIALGIGKIKNLADSEGIQRTVLPLNQLPYIIQIGFAAAEGSEEEIGESVLSQKSYARSMKSLKTPARTDACRSPNEIR